MMGWMMDEYSKLKGNYTPGVITGKPVLAGGSLGRTEATGFGLIYALRETLATLGIDSKTTTAAIQGFGNVAQYAAIGYNEILGGKVVTVSCWDRHVKKVYIDPVFLQSITDIYGTIDSEKAQAAGYKQEDAEAWISKDVDVLIPAAIEGQITGDTVGKISSSVKVIAEGANGPTTPEADAVLNKNKIFVIPDFLCNAGGVIVSYFEGVQNDMNFYWARDEVLERLNQKMTKAFHAVHDVSQERAMQFRGWL